MKTELTAKAFGDKKITLETGQIAKQANSSVFVKFGDTRVLVTATASSEAPEGIDFFPLTVNYIEKYYASGKIPGGYLKRETRPSDHATLVSRLIDRPLRPLFPKAFKNETQIIATVLSFDEDYDADAAALIGASTALCISDIPFAKPIAACHVARVNDKYIAFPGKEDLENSDLDIFVASSEDAILMVEGEADLVPEDVILDAIMFGFDSVQDIIKAQKSLMKDIGKTKMELPNIYTNTTIDELVEKTANALLGDAFSIKAKLARYEALKSVKKEVIETVLNSIKENNQNIIETDFDYNEDKLKKYIISAFQEVEHEFARNIVIKNNTRIDGRDFTTVRPIWCDTALLPRAHGSAIFTRGETQVLGVLTLGTAEDEQFIDSLSGLTKSKFFLHYNFPPFSVGEVRGLRAPGRREIGHGFLAQRGIQAILPKGNFPYTIRAVSEVLESNGSSSMGTVCSLSMALMDAGIETKGTVAGVAMGLIYDDKNKKHYILTDILGDEDHLGDMDFKVVGTRDGISAVQMDIKIDGIKKEVLEQALIQAKDGRIHIIEEMEKTISKPKTDLSKYLPRAETIEINKDKIKDIIGAGGKTIKAIVEKTKTKVNVNQEGIVSLFAGEDGDMALAKNIIQVISGQVEKGTVFDGKVIKIVDFGAFVEFVPGVEGLVHISEIAKERVKDVHDYLKEGQELQIVYLGNEANGKHRLSVKALID